MIKTLQRRFALSRQGAVDLIKGCIACVVQDISFMLPVGLLYYFVIDTMNGNLNGSRIAFYAVGSLVCLCLIFIATWFQYNASNLTKRDKTGKLVRNYTGRIVLEVSSDTIRKHLIDTFHTGRDLRCEHRDYGGRHLCPCR